MLDIIFLSYDEPNADQNYQRLINRFPHARRVHGVKGIANAHIAASKKSMTKFFYVVDADAVIDPSFDFSYKPQIGDEQYVHIWNAKNPIGLIYGYGGVKLLSKDFFKDVKNQLDFTTTLTKDIKLHEEVACTTEFNSDYLRAFRGAFREAAKLTVTISDETKSPIIRHEARQRLDYWLNPGKCSCREYVRLGALAGSQRAVKYEGDLMFINEHAELVNAIKEQFPNLDQVLDPTPNDSNPMKHEFFFTSRIAASLYDGAVLNSLPVTELRDAISDGQLLSKNWLIEKFQSEVAWEDFPNGIARVAILGGWIGTLALMMNSFELPIDVTSIDLDARANRIAEKLNWDFKFKTLTESMYEIDYSEYDVIINTSSEHIEDIGKWRALIPKNKILIVQNNDFEEGEGHVSCVKNSDDLKTLLNLSEVLYEGTRQFPQYNRFMLIGRT
jgi:hypothetical protein